ncbi:hypothetical protein C8R47DRAFT_1096884 [Mycena vitilis]|nr:hypothetical protein C8R47DRAFT_1096884 [Mycena vitilis]
MPSRTGYVPARSPSWGSPYAGPSTPSYPSPTYTQFSTSPGPSPPRPLNHSRPLYACAPLPALNCDIHPVLSAHGRHKPPIDIAHDPAYTFPALPVLSPRVLAEPAATNGVTSLPYFTIECAPFPWRIDVRPSSSKSGAYVTVADVFNSIYRGLHRRVPREELEAMSLSPHYISSVRRAFDSRCRSLAQVDPAAACAEGIRRIDFLLGNSLFAGLLPITSESPDAWKLAFYS